MIDFITDKAKKYQNYIDWLIESDEIAVAVLAIFVPVFTLILVYSALLAFMPITIGIISICAFVYFGYPIVIRLFKSIKDFNKK